MAGIFDDRLSAHWPLLEGSMEIMEEAIEAEVGEIQRLKGMQVVQSICRAYCACECECQCQAWSPCGCVSE